VSSGNCPIFAVVKPAVCPGRPSTAWLSVFACNPSTVHKLFSTISILFRYYLTLCDYPGFGS
jgi:hypothetical protein